MASVVVEVIKGEGGGTNVSLDLASTAATVDATSKSSRSSLSFCWLDLALLDNRLNPSKKLRISVFSRVIFLATPFINGHPFYIDGCKNFQIKETLIESDLLFFLSLSLRRSATYYCPKVPW